MGLFGKKKQEAPKEPAKPAPKPKDLEDIIFDIKFSAKGLGRLSTKATKQEGEEKLKCKQMIERGNAEGARIHAENAIRNHNQSLQYLKLQARLDAVASKLEGHSKMIQATGQMSDVTKNLAAALDTTDVEKIARVMDTFEKQFENLDLQAGFMDSAIADSMSTTANPSAVDTLMQQVADEHQLNVQGMLATGPLPKIGAQGQPTAAENDDLAQRFANLSGGNK